ncbi:hypothetical protein Taro_039633 [Colocasia esculenta]|uniref:DUF8040 domain-containing protein n=1 Tax=Colocasia esculenta TaxID=4460 RepID=A0A843WMS9_COLES|nr:hypothetical protein [Colocasia esculenta]
MAQGTSKGVIEMLKRVPRSYLSSRRMEISGFFGSPSPENSEGAKGQKKTKKSKMDFERFNPLALWFKGRSLPFYVDIVQLFRPSVDVDALVREIFCEENATFLAMDEAIADEIFESNEKHSVPRPMHTSSHSGHIWIHEVLQGHERCSYNVFRLHPTTFMKLRDELIEKDLICDSRYVTTTEKLTIFIYAMGHGMASGAMCEHFQHSYETISKHVREVIKALASLRFTYIKLPSLTHPVHPRIQHDDRFYPYFKFNPLAAGFKERTLSLHNDLVNKVCVTSRTFWLFVVWGMIGLVVMEVPVAIVIPVATAFGVVFLSHPVNGSRLLYAFWLSDACQSGRRGRLTCQVVAEPRAGGERFPSRLPPAVKLGGVAGELVVERRSIVEQGGGGRGVVKALRGVWGTPGCSIPVVGLPADVTIAEHVATSEKVSPRSDATLSRRGWPSR